MANGSATELLASASGNARPMADDKTEGPAAGGDGAARPLDNDSGEEPVAGGAARHLASAADEDASVGFA